MHIVASHWRRFAFLLAVAVSMLAAISASAKDAEPALSERANAALAEKADTPIGEVTDEAGDGSSKPRYGDPQTIRFRVGAEITAKKGACRNVVAMVTVPLECPEQEVKIVDEDISPNADVTYRMLGAGARQMLISVPSLADGATAHAYVTAEVSTRPILAPEVTGELAIPEKVPSKLKMYLTGSPYIEVKHPRIRALKKEISDEVGDKATDWEMVEAIYDAVLKKIEYVEGPDKGAVQSLKDGQADCQGRSAVFIALCRANKIPARMVWVDGHCYPEFYMEQEPGKGDWYPCESAGTRAFGEMPLARTILQKGDNFRVPERKEKLRYASDFTIGLPTPGGGKPSVKYVRQQLTN
jgi:transglutaminase-like putative cysteine protease